MIGVRRWDAALQRAPRLTTKARAKTNHANCHLRCWPRSNIAPLIYGACARGATRYRKNASQGASNTSNIPAKIMIKLEMAPAWWSS